MPNMTQWELDKLNEYKEEYFQLLKEKEKLTNALKPIIKKIVFDILEEKD